MPNRILIATGGTGGHLYPALALGRQLKKKGHHTLFAFRFNSSVANVLSVEKFNFAEVSSAPFFGQNIFRIIAGMFLNIRGIFQSMKIISQYNPDCVVGFGAYVSVPVVIAGFLKGKPVLLHEQNAVPGWANRFCSYFATKVAVSFSETMEHFAQKAVLTGNLVREEIFDNNAQDSRSSLGLKEGRSTILVFGGSGGARGINRWILECLSVLLDLKESIQFLHITGNAEETENARSRYKEHGFHAVVMDYSNEMGKCYAGADFAVCRSGATTIAELSATKLPAILIPYPYATNDHQRKNARVLESLNAAVVFIDNQELGRKLSAKIRELVRNPDRLQEMREGYKNMPINVRESSDKVCQVILELAGGGK